jgi:CBS domain containing-hemolysin-like protein
MIGGLVVACWSAISARSFFTFSRHDLEEICRRHENPSRLSEILKRHDRVGLAAETLQVVATAVVAIAGSVWLWTINEQMTSLNGPTFVSTIVIGSLILLLIEIWIPWAVAQLWGSWITYISWPLWKGVPTLLFPLILGARFFDTILHRLAGRVQEEPSEDSFEDEIRTIVTEGHREGFLEEDAREMIEGVMELGDVDVSEIMTPRTDMTSISISISQQEMLDFVIKQGHTRIPVYQKTRDDIVGILYIKDLLPELVKQNGSGPPKEPWSSLLREPYFIPETKPIDVLLQEFQHAQHHMAIVLDEYGGVSGLVTMEDILEEIVGEIEDEYDKGLVDGVRQVEAGIYDVLGNVHLDEINERLKLTLPEDGDFDTIGGYVFTELGHVPQVGEELALGNTRITVMEVTQRRILRVRIELDEE